MQDDITELLEQWGAGRDEALEELMPQVVGELRKLAQAHFRREAAGHTLQPTALVSELYLRLASQTRVRFANRTQFYAFASRLIRRILVDHHRARRTAKRGLDRPKISFDDALGVPKRREVDLLALDDALGSLETLDPKLARIVELRFFAGLTVPEVGEVLGISPASVKREWTSARAFLAREALPA